MLKSVARMAMLMAALSLGVAGCGRLSLPFRGEKKVAEPAEQAAPKPPDYIKITGVGNADSLGPVTTNTLSFSGVMSGPIRAESAAALDGQIADPAQRVLMAQAEARRKALRTLGQVILSQRDAQGGPLGEALKKSPADQSRLNTLLEEQAKVTFAMEGTGVHATAMIDGGQVMSAIGLAGPQAGAASAPGGASLQAKKEASYNLALDDAKRKLEQALMESKAPEGEQTVREALEENPDAKVDFNAMLWVVQPDETTYGADGSCQLTIFFDRNRLQDIFKNNGRPWWRPRLRVPFAGR